MSAKTPRIPVTPEMLRLLQKHKERTGVGAHKLLSGKRSILPEGLNGTTVQNVMNGLTTSIRKDYYHFILSLWEEMPDNPQIEITKEIRDHFRNVRTQISSVIDCPKLRTKAHNVYKYGQKTAPKHLVETIMRIRPDEHQYRPITKNQFKSLAVYKDRFNLLPGHIFRISDSIPEGLNPHIISSWISGQTQTARSDNIEWVLSRCESILRSSWETVSDKHF